MSGQVHTIACISEPTHCWYLVMLISGVTSDGRVILESMGIFTGQELAILQHSRISLMYWDWESVVMPFEMS